MDKLKILYKLLIVEDGNHKLSWFDGEGVFTVGSGKHNFTSPHCQVPKQAELLTVKGQLRLLSYGPRTAGILVERGEVMEEVKKSKSFRLLDDDILHFSEKLKIHIRFTQPTDQTKNSSSTDSGPSTAPFAGPSSVPSSTTHTTALPSSSSASKPIKSASTVASSSKTSGRPSKIAPPTFATPKPQRQGYPLRFLDPATPQAQPFPSSVEPAFVLGSTRFVPCVGGNHVAILFHIPVTLDVARERREINDIVLILTVLGFKVEVIEEATYDLCQRAVNARLKKMKDRGEVINTFCMFVASHGIDNSSKRLSILMHDKSFLDSVQLAAWAFDFNAEFTFIILLTCHAESAAHGIVWPSTTRGGLIWASNKDRTAGFKDFHVQYKDGSTSVECHDVFVRSIFEILFTLVDVTELEYNISLGLLCSLWRSAASTADPTSSFGYQPNWNGHEIPLRLRNYLRRQEFLVHGCIQKRIECIDGHIVWTPYRVPGLVLGGGATSLTAALQRQIDERPIWDTIPGALVIVVDDDDDDETSPTRTTQNTVSHIESEESIEVNTRLFRSGEETALNDDTLSNTETIKDDSKTPVGLSDKKMEEKTIRSFNLKSGWKCREICRSCSLRMISPETRTVDADHVTFQKLNVKFYTLCASKAARNCIACSK